MKERNAHPRKSGIFLLLLLISFAVPAVRGDFAEPSEVIYVAVFFGGAYGDHLSKMILLDFDDVDGLPVDTGLPCFGDGFVEGKYETISWGTQGYAARVRAHYDISIGNETAEAYADQVCHEFLDVFNQTGLETFDRTRFVKGETIEILIDNGYFPDNLAITESLLTYKPTEGFADLITPDFLNIFVPHNFSCGCVELSYTLRRVADDFIWNFQFGYSTSKWMEDVKDVETVNLQGLLSTSSMEPSPQRSSTIMINIVKKTVMRSGTYSLNFENVLPPGFTEEDKEGTLTVTYNLTGPVDNVVAEIGVTPEQSSALYGLLVVVIVAVVAALLFFRYHRSTKEKEAKRENEEDTASSGNAVDSLSLRRT